MGSSFTFLLVGQVRLLQDVLALVIEDEVGALGVPALVRPKHDVVRGRITEGGGIAQLGANLHIATATLNVLFILGLQGKTVVWRTPL
jgi:hypothetical protein